jgi:hypothetical protein
MQSYTDIFIDDDVTVELSHVDKYTSVRFKSKTGVIGLYFEGEKGRLMAKAIVASVQVVREKYQETAQ